MILLFLCFNTFNSFSEYIPSCCEVLCNLPLLFGLIPCNISTLTQTKLENTNPFLASVSHELFLPPSEMPSLKYSFNRIFPTILALVQLSLLGYQLPKCPLNPQRILTSWNSHLAVVSLPCTSIKIGCKCNA